MLTQNVKVVETTVYSHDGKLTTHPTDIGEWYSDEICRIVDFSSTFEKISLPEGEYKVTITLEKI